MPPPDLEHIRLSFGDLKLLMDNYQNMIQLNTVLLEQQKHAIELQHDVIRRQENISVKQIKTCERLDVIINKIDLCVDGFQKTIETTKSSCSTVKSVIVDKVDDTENKVDSLRLDIVNQHSKISNKIYVALGGSAVVILALVGLLMTAYGKYTILQEVHDMIQQMILFFNLT